MVNVHERLRLASPIWSRYPSESSDATTTGSSTQDSYASGPLAQPRQLRYSWSSRESTAPLPPHHESSASRHHQQRGGGRAASSSHESSSTSSFASSTNSSGNNERSVRSMLDGFIASTFLSCVHQPIASCVSGDASNDWDYRYEGSSFRNAPTLSARKSRHAHRARGDASRGLSPSREDDDHDDDDDYAIAAPPPSATCDFSTSRPAAAMVAVKTPGENDVVCGKGGSRVQHPGNERFRELCRANRPAYATLTKKQKVVMAGMVVRVVRGTRPPGHFLARNPHTGLWEDVGMERSLEKAAQALRDRAASSSHGERAAEDPDDERRTDDMPVSPVPSGVSSTASSSSARTPRSSTGRTAPPPLPRLQIPAHLRSVFRPVHQPPPAALRTPLLADPSMQGHAAAGHARGHHHPQPYVSPVAYHRYPSLRGEEVPEEELTGNVITPEGRGGHGFRSHETVLAHSKHAWKALPLPALPDAPDDELMFSPGPMHRSHVSNQTAEPTTLLLDPDGGWSQYPPRLQAQRRGCCEPDGEFPDDEDMAAPPSLVSMSTVTQASSSLVSAAWSAPRDRNYDDHEDEDDGRLRRPLPLFSPSGLLQGREHHFQSRGSRSLAAHADFAATYAHNHLPQPSATNGCGGGGGYDSDTSMDGGTALSTALFLRLDESEE